MAVPICIATGNEWEWLLLRILPALGVVSVLDLGHSYRCVVKSHHCFHLNFSDDIRCWAFSVPSFVPLVSFMVRYQSLFPIFSYCWVLRVLCIFWISLFIRCVFCKYFLPVCGLFSHPLGIVFWRAEFLILMKSSLSMTSFMDHTFGAVDMKKVI